MLPQRIIEALGWTLFHSLWQGALAALVFAVVLYFTRRTSARLRYGLGLATLALVLLMSGLTFWNHYSGSGPAGSAALVGQAATASAATQPTVLPAPAGAPGQGSRAQRIAAFFSDYFSRHLPLIVSLWLLGVLFLTLRFSGSLLYIQRLKYWQNRPLPSPWPEKLQELAARAGLRRPLRLLESLRLKTPVVIGHLKPVLLLPAGLVSGLPADEVEALLAHELAHILRRDYLVNVMQHLVDILFFFHPGIRWISAAVRQEREHCCDDFAVELCGDARHYALALARLQAAGPGYPQPALAAAGRAHKLLRRIARLLGKPQPGPRFPRGLRQRPAAGVLPDRYAEAGRRRCARCRCHRDQAQAGRCREIPGGGPLRTRLFRTRGRWPGQADRQGRRRSGRVAGHLGRGRQRRPGGLVHGSGRKGRCRDFLQRGSAPGARRLFLVPAAGLQGHGAMAARGRKGELGAADHVCPQR